MSNNKSNNIDISVLIEEIKWIETQLKAYSNQLSPSEIKILKATLKNDLKAIKNLQKRN